ncbi:MAG: hypothetical protein HZA49_00200 [Planctomycetes bacterium]|nr:hypothetical protein [Planctomycetota bacterium]
MADEINLLVPPPQAKVFACYGHAWRRLWKTFLMLLLVNFILFLLTTPNFMPFCLGYIYGIMVGWPLSYGTMLVNLKAARGEQIQVEDLFAGFKNYGNVLLASLLTTIIITTGFIMLIVPGIIFACKLAFVPYLVMEGKADAGDAIAQSWIMTRGYTLKIFLIGLLSIPIIIGGIICLCVGVIPTFFWISLASASMYYAVSAAKPG